jgi:uncharacterized protein (DUF433 family)
MKMKRKMLGKHIVADPAICHGKPTFVNTRIMVADVLEQVAEGMAWEDIRAEWRGCISAEAIAEAIALANAAFRKTARLSSAQTPVPSG